MTPFLEDFIIYLMGLTFPFYLIKSLFCAYFSDIIWCFLKKRLIKKAKNSRFELLF